MNRLKLDSPRTAPALPSSPKGPVAPTKPGTQSVSGSGIVSRPRDGFVPTAPTLGKPKLKFPETKPTKLDAIAKIDIATSAGTKLAESGVLLSRQEAKQVLRAELRAAGVKGGQFTNLAVDKYMAARATPLKPIPCELSREAQSFLDKEAGALVAKGPLGLSAKDLSSTFKNAVKVLGLEGSSKREARLFFFNSFRTQAAEQWTKSPPQPPEPPRFPVIFR